MDIYTEICSINLIFFTDHKKNEDAQLQFLKHREKSREKKPKDPQEVHKISLNKIKLKCIHLYSRLILRSAAIIII